MNRKTALIAYALILLLSFVGTCFRFVKPVEAATNTISGDCDGDGDVDSTDLFMLAAAYGTENGDLLYNSNCDFNDDDDVDSVDLFTLASNYGARKSKIYHGIAVPAHQACMWTVYTDTDYARFVSWGLNSVLYNIWWTQYWEADELNPGGYNEVWLTALEKQVALALAHDLKPFLCSHVNYQRDGGYGWADTMERGPDYVNLNQQDASGSKGRERYCNWLKMLAQRFPDCGIDPWGFPYHGAWDILIGYPEKEVTFYNTTQRAFLEAIRSVSDQPIILNPLQQGVWRDADGRKFMTGQFVNPNFRAHDDYSDILYGTNSHDALGASGANSYNAIAKGGSWNYDTDYMRQQMQPAIDFAKTHDVVCVELCDLNIHEPGLDYRPIDQSRLDWVKATLQAYKDNNMSWFYYRYENPPGNSSPMEKDGSNSAVAQLIAEYAYAKVDTQIVFTFTPNPARPGQTVKLSGTIKDVYGNPVYPAKVQVYYSLNGGLSWNYIWTLTTNTAGEFSKTFNAPSPGKYLVGILYSSSTKYNQSTDTGTLIVQ